MLNVPCSRKMDKNKYFVLLEMFTTLAYKNVEVSNTDATINFSHTVHWAYRYPIINNILYIAYVSTITQIGGVMVSVPALSVVDLRQAHSVKEKEQILVGSELK
jgi:hypothetical protein